MEHGEGDVVLAGRELKNFGVSAGFLSCELVAWEAEYREAGCFVVFVKRTQTCVLRGKASSAGDVDNQKYLAAEVAHCNLFAGDGFHREVIDIGHGDDRSARSQSGSVRTMSIADEKYVSLVTVKRDGTAMPTAVWIASLGDGVAGFTTDLTSGKVKRIRNNSAVTLTPCDSRGRLRDGAAAVHATATILVGAQAEPVAAAIRKKYGVMVPLIGLMSSVRNLFKRGADNTECAISLQIEA